MLGCQHEEDVATLPPFTPPGAADEDEDRIPEDEQSRFARRIPDDMTEAYEWGGLTTGSWVKALWVLYLPFTLINAGGWAHHAAVPDDDRQPFTLGVHLVTTHVVAVLSTVTYVLWIGYLLLDLTAVRWWEHVQQENEVTGTAADWADSGLEPAAAALFVLVIGLLAIVPNRQGKFEGDVLLDRDGDNVGAPWPRVPRISDPMFFAMVRARQRAYWIHIAIGGAVAAFALYLTGRGIHRLGAAGHALRAYLAGLHPAPPEGCRRRRAARLAQLLANDGPRRSGSPGRVERTATRPAGADRR
jgi:hypothetical protein